MPNDSTSEIVEEPPMTLNRSSGRSGQNLDAAQRQRTPISMLPEEVLLIIFIMVRDADFRDPKVVLNTITHICRDWRYIATHAALLWTRPLSLRHPDWTAAALQRSKSAPISVQLDFRRLDGLCELSKKLLGHISRISTLEIHAPAVILDEAQEMIPEDDASQLTDLKLWCSWYGVGVGVLRRSFLLSSTAFRNTHRLRHLSLINVCIDFRSPLLRNLTSLWISYQPNEAVLPSWLQILQALDAMPHLEDLSMFKIFPPLEAFEEVSPLEGVRLHSLNRLHLECDAASGVHAFLAHVYFPPLAAFQVQWRTSDLGEDQITIFEMIAEAAYSGTFGAKIWSLELCHAIQFGVAFTILRTHSTSGGPWLGVTMPYNLLDIAGVSVVTNFIDLMGATNIEVFQAPSVDHDFDDEDVLRLIEKMPLLETIDVCSATAWNLIDILSIEALASPSESGPHIRLPKLKTITMTRCDFAGSETWIDKVAIPLFAMRQEHDAGVEELYLEDCDNLSPEMLRTLEAGVPQVVIPKPFCPQPRGTHVG